MKPNEWREWWELRGKAELRLLLRKMWDPIGNGAAEDAYDAYLEPVATLLRDGAEGAVVAECLWRIERETMKLRASIDDLEPVGDLIVAWYRTSTGSPDR